MATYKDFESIYGKYSAFLDGADSPTKPESKELAASMTKDPDAHNQIRRKSKPEVISEYLLYYAAKK